MRRRTVAIALLTIFGMVTAKVRYFAARSLAEPNGNSQPAIPALIQSLQDKNEFVRMAAAFALGKFGRGAASTRSALLPLLKDPNTDVRACANSPSNKSTQTKLSYRRKNDGWLWKPLAFANSLLKLNPQSGMNLQFIRCYPRRWPGVI
ncbi:HEAT repeat domain-containing protein [Pedosphaera parvula]|uniref:HEAT domain containing protein n=1 Tax=Pedosphaera parvula (strain Ellin514) TaxID=320771 RepID=B9XLM7_PEDPL|nr:HEAT repeat domain-containing protein [Pedosphaera parvula]EEF59275.1 HEAT domain containing protein [Pedosphaera parvula Ellin514]